MKILFNMIFIFLLIVIFSGCSSEDEHEDHKETSDTHSEEHEQDSEKNHDEEENSHGDGHEEHGGEEDEHSGESESVSLSNEQMALSDIKVTKILARQMNYQHYAPGEIKANGYTSYMVSPRVDSVVIRRHAGLGEHVEKGQALVALFSEEVADAQANYRIIRSEWDRVKNLGRKTVGDKRFFSAQSEFNAAAGRLKTFGLSEKAIESVMDSNTAFGEYALVAEISGAVLTDDFNQGQRVDAGDTLMKLADESSLWVEARIEPSSKLQLPSGSAAVIVVDNEYFDAAVIQEAHTIDPITRTRVIRLLVSNQLHRLHPGMFADVIFKFETNKAVMAVPEGALMRSADGDWIVFVEGHPGEFEQVEVELGRALGFWREVKGIESGVRVVTEGAFFVASELAKGGFDPHNH